MMRSVLREPMRNILRGSFDGLSGIDFDLYNFYVNFPELTDQISKQALTTTLTSGRYSYSGAVYGTDEPVIEADGSLLTNGAYTVLNGKSNDISDPYWSLINGATTPAIDEFLSTAVNGVIFKSIETIEGNLYTLSFYARVIADGQLTTYEFNTVNSASGGTQSISTLSYIRHLYDVTVLGRVGGGTVNFGFKDKNTSNWSKVFIDTINVTETPYAMPPAINTTTGTLSVPLNYSDATHGVKAEGIQANFPQLWFALRGTDGTDAQGRITIPITPKFDAADVSGVVNILTANDEEVSFLFYNGATQEIHTYDGTNTAVVAYVPVNGTQATILLDYGDDTGQKMRLTVDATVGAQATNAGSFPVTADDLSIGWETDEPFQIGAILIEKEPTW